MQTIDRQQIGTAVVDPNGRDWLETESPGFLVKPMFKDEATGETTMLMRIEPGAWVPAHAHEQLEEIYVLEGDFYDEEHQYRPGQYLQRAIGAMHTAGSVSGGTVLLIYRN